MKLKIRPSNLCFRFYKTDGWTLEKVKQYTLEPEHIKITFANEEYGYYLLDIHATLLLDKFLKNCEIVHCWFWTKKERLKTDEQIAKQYYRTI